MSEASDLVLGFVPLNDAAPLIVARERGFFAAEGGGNCEYTKPGETIQVGQVTIVAPLNVPSMLGEHASELYAKNQFNLLELMIKDKALNLDWSDEVVAKTCLTHGGEIKNEAAKKAVEG